MKTFPIRIVDGKIKFYAGMERSSLENFLRENEGRAEIVPKNKISWNQRKFFEGVIVVYFALQSSYGTDFIGARNALKREFNPTFFKDIHGNTVQEGETTTALDKEKFDAFLKRIERHFMENGYLFPDSEDYKKWVNSAPELGEEYPPLTEIKNKYGQTK